MYDSSNSVGIVDEDFLFALNDSKGVNSSYFRKENYKQRIYTIDVMRGIAVISMIISLPQYIFNDSDIYGVFKCTEWNGLNVGDFVMSLFLFVTGCTVYLSYLKNKDEYKTYELIGHICKKTIILVFCGVCFNWLAMKNPFCFETLMYTKITSFFFRIGICYLFISLLNLTGIVFVVIFIFISFFIYIFFMHFYQVEYCGNNYLIPNCNFASFADEIIFSRRHMKYPTDNLGFFCTLNAMYTTFSGYLVIYILKKEQSFQKNQHNLRIIAWFGAINLALFAVFTFLFNIPINMSIYSSSFMFLCSGIFPFLFVFIYYFTSLKKTTIYKKICTPFECFGLNSFVLYSLTEVINIIMTQVNLKNVKFMQEYIQIRNLLYGLIILLFEGGIAVLLYIKNLHFKI